MPTRDFTRVQTGREPVQFTIDGDTFHAVPLAPGGAMLDMAAVQDGTNSEKVRAISEFLDMVLTEESAVLFAARLRDKKRPITLDQATEVVVWLVEEAYTDRPTN